MNAKVGYPTDGVHDILLARLRGSFRALQLGPAWSRAFSFDGRKDSHAVRYVTYLSGKLSVTPTRCRYTISHLFQPANSRIRTTTRDNVKPIGTMAALPLPIPQKPVKKLNQDDDDVSTGMEPSRAGKITDFCVAENVGKARQGSQSRHNETCTKKPKGGIRPCFAACLPKYQIHYEGGYEERNRERNQHWMDRMARNLSRRFGVAHVRHHFGIGNRRSIWSPPQCAKTKRQNRAASLGRLDFKCLGYKTPPDQHEGLFTCYDMLVKALSGGKPRGSRETPHSALTPRLQELAYGEG